MAEDAAWFRRGRNQRRPPDGWVTEGSFLADGRDLPPASRDLLITSPPYLNNYHYNYHYNRNITPASARRPAMASAFTNPSSSCGRDKQQSRLVALSQACTALR